MANKTEHTTAKTNENKRVKRKGEKKCIETKKFMQKKEKHNTS
jgi:hypothetical protein